MTPPVKLDAPSPHTAPAIASSRPARLFVLVARLVLGAVFVYAAYMKLRDPWELFAMSINSYDVLPLAMAETAARVIPWLELALGVMLISGLWLRISGTILSLILLTFFSLMVRAYAKGMQINCGCFGPGEIISLKTLLRDGSMAAAAIAMTALAFLQHRHTAAK
jgi:uncharacterized membrane protein YphA (DoxX/SURF4 family)